MNHIEELERRDVVIKYLKQVDYKLEPSKNIYDRIKDNIIKLSGLESDVTKSYAELCKMAGLEIKEGKSLIKSLYNKELIKVVKSYDAILLNQGVEACFINKSYTREVIPDIAFLTEDQAYLYLANIMKLGTNASIFSYLDKEDLNPMIDLLSISDKEKEYLKKAYANRGFKILLANIMSLSEETNMRLTTPNPVNYMKDFLKISIDNSKKHYKLRQLLSAAVRYNNNINKKYYCGSCTLNSGEARYLYPF